MPTMFALQYARIFWLVGPEGRIFRLGRVGGWCGRETVDLSAHHLAQAATIWREIQQSGDDMEI